MAPVVVLLVVGGLPATAQDQDTAVVMVVHAVPDVAGFPADICLNGDVIINAMLFEGMSSPAEIPAGEALFEIYPSGADPGTSEAAVSQSVGLEAGTNYTVVAQLLEGSPALSLYVNDTTALPAGSSRLTVRQTSEEQAIDVTVDGEVCSGGVRGPVDDHYDRTGHDPLDVCPPRRCGQRRAFNETERSYADNVVTTLVPEKASATSPPRILVSASSEPGESPVTVITIPLEELTETTVSTVQGATVQRATTTPPTAAIIVARETTTVVPAPAVPERADPGVPGALVLVLGVIVVGVAAILLGLPLVQSTDERESKRSRRSRADDETEPVPELSPWLGDAPDDSAAGVADAAADDTGAIDVEAAMTSYPWITADLTGGPDDLSLVVDLTTAARLRQIGITRIEQLATLDPESADVLAAAGIDLDDTHVAAARAVVAQRGGNGSER